MTRTEEILEHIEQFKGDYERISKEYEEKGNIEAAQAFKHKATAIHLLFRELEGLYI